MPYPLSFHFARLLFVAIVALVAKSALAADAAPSAPAAAPPPPSVQSVVTATRTFLRYCFQVDGLDASQIKARLEMCKPALEGVKSGTDAETAFETLSSNAAQHSHTAAVAQDERGWGRTWYVVLVVGDVIAILGALVVIRGVLKSPDPTGLLREETATGAAGKVSFSRVVGLIGGLAALTFVGLIINVCLSYLFVTDKMPDQLGATFTAAVGTFFSALMPYLINKLKG